MTARSAPLLLAAPLLLTAALLLCSVAARAQAPSFPCSVLRRLPHDEGAFTQGLLMHQGEFIESTGLYGQSSIRRVDPETGRARLSQALPARLFGEGAAVCPEMPTSQRRKSPIFDHQMVRSPYAPFGSGACAMMSRSL